MFTSASAPIQASDSFVTSRICFVPATAIVVPVFLPAFACRFVVAMRYGSHFVYFSSGRIVLR